MSEEKKIELSQWFTPKSVSENLWSMVLKECKPRSVLEPSAGTGSLLIPVLNSASVPERIVAYDIDPDMAFELSFNMGDLVEVIEGDFLTSEIDERFDVALMNPPYEEDQDMAFILKAFEYCDLVAGIFKTDLFHSKKRYSGNKQFPGLWANGIRSIRGARAVSRWRFGGDQSPSRNYMAVILELTDCADVGRTRESIEKWEWWE